MPVSVSDNREEGPRFVDRDVKRHNELVRKALREKLPDIITNEEVISSEGQKVIRVKVPMKKEPQFRFGWAPQGVGQGGGARKGQKLNNPNQPQGQGQGQGQGQQGQQPAQGVQGGDEGADWLYEEYTIDEIFDLLVEDLELPDLEPKGEPRMAEQEKRKPRGTQPKGPMGRIHEEDTFVRHEERRIATDSPQNEPIIDDDIRFKRIGKTKPKPVTNAVVILGRDVSGSMDEEKQYLSKALCWFLVTWVRRKYANVALVFLAHDTEAKEVPEKDFFKAVFGGGTHISSVYVEGKRFIDEIYRPEFWDAYFLHCTDGDNSAQDNGPAIAAADELAELVKLFGYAEIKTSSSFMQHLEGLKTKHSNFATVTIKERTEVRRAFIDLLKHEQAEVTA